MKEFVNAFWHIEEMDYTKLAKIDDYFGGDFKYAWNLGTEKHLFQAGIRPVAVERIMQKGLLGWEKLWHQVATQYEVIGRTDTEFPACLKQIEFQPYSLYVRGKFPGLSGRRTLAIVGTRKPSATGRKLSFNTAKQFAGFGGIVISGLAFGIDAEAHQGAIEAGQTNIAVIASGIEDITPRSHRQLAQRILEVGGCVLSEYPISVGNLRLRYRERNRIISGLAEKTLIVEAGDPSGALMTADHAANQGREAYAFPGDVGKIQCKGSNKMIHDGKAMIVLSIEELLEKYGFMNQKDRLNLSLEEMYIINRLAEKTCSLEELIEKRHYSEVTFALTNLEMEGIVRRNFELKWELS